LDPTHLGTSAKLSIRYIGTYTEVSEHIGTYVLQVVTGDSIIHTVL